MYVLKAADEQVQHDVVRRVRVRPDYLRQTTSLSATGLFRWLGANLGRFRYALLRTARRHPVGLVRAAAQAFAQAVRARRGFLATPRKRYFKEFLLAVDLADRLDASGDVRWLHAHFAHGTTTVTWLTSTITGLPFSFTGHAKDIWTQELNPAGLLRRKIDAASFVVTCTGVEEPNDVRCVRFASVHVTTNEAASILRRNRPAGLSSWVQMSFACPVKENGSPVIMEASQVTVVVPCAKCACSRRTSPESSSRSARSTARRNSLK